MWMQRIFSLLQCDSRVEKHGKPSSQIWSRERGFHVMQIKPQPAMREGERRDANFTPTEQKTHHVQKNHSSLVPTNCSSSSFLFCYFLFFFLLYFWRSKPSSLKLCWNNLGQCRRRIRHGVQYCVCSTAT